MKIYLSPSNQDHNKGYGSYGSEQTRMFEIAEKLKLILERCKQTVYISKKGMTYQQAVSESNKRKCDIHIAIHSNAFNTAIRGTQTMYVSNSGKRLAQGIYDLLEAFTPTQDRGNRENKNLYELNNTTAVSAYLELMFHDNKEDATLIMNNVEYIAELIARGTCKYLKIPYIDKIAKTSDKLYHVQIGAYGIKSNADNIVKELEQKGYKPFIKFE